MAASLLSPAVAHIVWVLRDQDEVEVDYAHFGLPLILAVDRVFRKVRNLTVRHISGETLFPLEVTQYDPWVIREALHNCIAHQDYRQAARITVTERPGSLMFTNRGEFIPGTVLNVIALDRVQKEGYPIPKEERDLLRKKNLIEGRHPNLYVSEIVAAKTDTRADYIRNRSFDRAYFKDMVVKYLLAYHEAKRWEIEKLLLDKVSDALNEEQKRQFIKDLLQEMRKEGTITTAGKTRGAKWMLTLGTRDDA